MSRPDYRIGILGASRIAPKAIIAPALRRGDCTVAAIACRDVERGRAYAAEHGVGLAEVLGSYQALCERPDIDIVYNALPPSLHVQTAAFAAGKAQLIEKPLAMSARVARKIAELPGTIMEGFHHRYHPAFGRFLERVRALGPLTRMEGRFHVSIPDRPGQLRYNVALGGGAMGDLGTYPLHIARTVAGVEPTVASRKIVRHAGGVDVAVEARLDFDGVPALISCDMREGVERVNYFEVEGARGVVRFDNPVHPYRGCTITAPDGVDRTEEHPRWAAVTTYDAQLAHLLLCLGMGTEPATGRADFTAHAAALEAVLAG